MKKRLSVNKKTTSSVREKPNFGFFKAILFSFFSKQLYIDVIRRWRGIGLLYLFVMLSILMLPFAVRVATIFHQAIEENVLIPIQKLPPFSVRSGDVQFYSPMPYLVKNNQDEVIAVIDTTGKVKQLPYFLYPKATILVTEHALHTLLPSPNFLGKEKNLDSKESLFSFDKLGNANIVGADFLTSGSMRFAIKGLNMAMYPMLLMRFFGVYAAFLFSFGLFAQFLTRFIFKVRLTFQETTRVIAVAATPQAMIYFLLLMFKKTELGNALLYFILLAVFFSWAILAYRRDSQAVLVP